MGGERVNDFCFHVYEFIARDNFFFSDVTISTPASETELHNFLIVDPFLTVN